MRRLLAAALIFAGGAAFAQPAEPPALTPAQTEGRAIVSRSCSICHLPPQFGAATYGPKLDQASLGGNDSVLREVISNGTPRMPAFKHMYQPAQIDSVIAWLKTVPAPPAAAAPR